MANFLERAFTAHVADKDKIRRAVLRRGTMTPEEIRRDDLCEFGDLLKGEESRRQGCDPTFRQLTEAHAEFHSAAYDAYSLNRQGGESAEFLEKSREIIRLIAKMRVTAGELTDG